MWSKSQVESTYRLFQLLGNRFLCFNGRTTVHPLCYFYFLCDTIFLFLFSDVEGDVNDVELYSLMRTHGEVAEFKRLDKDHYLIKQEVMY